MESNTRMPTDKPKTSRKPTPSDRGVNSHYSDIGEVGHIIWDLFSIGNHMHKIRQVWAKRAGVTGPQWLILFATSTLDEGMGVSIGSISRKLHVKSTFVTTQSKILEAEGYLVRKTHPEDKRVVLLSLSKMGKEKSDSFIDARTEVHRIIFGEFSEKEFIQLSKLISRLEQYTEAAPSQIPSKRLLG